MNGWKAILESETDYSATHLEELFKAYVADQGVGIGQVLLPYRYVITATMQGPSMFEVSEFLGKEECLKRFEEGLKSAQ